MILDLVHAKIRRELKFQEECIYPEEMLETLEKIQGDEFRLPELMTQFFTTNIERGETVMGFSYRLGDLYNMINYIRHKQRNNQLEEEMLRNQFIRALRDEIAQKLLREKIRNNPDVTFLEARNFPVRWCEPDSLSEVFEYLLQNSETQTTSM